MTCPHCGGDGAELHDLARGSLVPRRCRVCGGLGALDDSRPYRRARRCAHCRRVFQPARSAVNAWELALCSFCAGDGKPIGAAYCRCCDVSLAAGRGRHGRQPIACDDCRPHIALSRRA